MAFRTVILACVIALAPLVGYAQTPGQVQGRVESITVGEPPAEAGTDGEPTNAVGGREAMLTSVRDSYTAAIGVYLEAATIFEKAGAAPAKSQAATGLVEQGAATATRAGAAMDAAAGTLAPGLRVERARDLIWLHTAPDTYRQLVLERGWTLDEYERWFAASLAAALLPTGAS